MNCGEPSDDLSKIRGEILSSGDPFTLPRTYTCTECSYGKVDSWGGAGTPARITGDSYKNGREVNSTRQHSGMDVDPSGKDNHSGPGTWRPFSRTKKTELSWGKPYESQKRR
ncbi:hypothetical protein ACS0TY_024565 [Phlomoides rotata]